MSVDLQIVPHIGAIPATPILKRFAGVWSLWALGVGAVISGHFSGWNLGLAAGGWGGLLVAAVIMAVMYTALVFAIAEMSAALPRTGGATPFVEVTMGPWGAMLAGIAETVEYAVTPAVTCYFIGAYLGAIVGDQVPQWVWWVGTYAVFLALNMLSVALSFRINLLVTLASLAILLFFIASALPNVDFDRWALDIAADGSLLPDGHGELFPMGIAGVLASLPFAVWLYLAIEELPLAAEESIDPVCDMPKGIVLAMVTLVVTALLIAVVNPAVVGVGAHRLATSGEPLLDGFRAIFGGVGADVLGLVAITGLVASFHAILYAQGRQIFSLARAGYLPCVLAATHAGSQTPRVAMLTGAAVGLGTMLGLSFLLGGADAGAMIGSVLLNMAVFGAMVAYVLRSVAFILLRRRHPHMPRPYRSPFGVTGAVLTIVICVVTLAYQIQDPHFLKGAAWVLVAFAISAGVFAATGQARKLRRKGSDFASAQHASHTDPRPAVDARPAASRSTPIVKPHPDFSLEWLMTVTCATAAATLALNGLDILAIGILALTAVLSLVLASHQFDPAQDASRHPSRHHLLPRRRD